MPPDDKRGVDRIPQLVRELAALRTELAETFVPSAYQLSLLLEAAEYLTMAHQFVRSAPEVMGRARNAALLEGYNSAAAIVRAFARDLVQNQMMIGTQAALEKVATVLEATVEEFRGPQVPERPKPKLVLN